MARTKCKGVSISGLVNVLAKNQIDYSTQDKIFETNAEHFIAQTGIACRFEEQDDSINVEDYFNRGIDQLVGNLNWETDSIDYLICVTQTAGQAFPSVSNRIHGTKNFPVSMVCFDINSGCSGLVYGLRTISSLLASSSNEKSRGILCVGDLSSRIIDANDATTKPIFSDAVSVFGLEFSEKREEEWHFHLQTFGSGKEAITSKMTNQGEKMQLNGLDVFHYSLKFVPQHIQQLLDQSEVLKENVNGFILHQANKLINDSIRKKLTIEPDRFPESLSKFGNTASASIGMTWQDWNKHAVGEKTGWLVLCGFGVGFSIASVLIPNSSFPMKTTYFE